MQNRAIFTKGGEFVSFWVKDKSFYQKMAAIAIPLALQNLINVGVSLLDTVMLGQLGEVAMSGSASIGAEKTPLPFERS